MMLMDRAISQARSLTLIYIGCVVKPPLSCQTPMVSAVHWLSPTLAISGQTRTCWVGIWNVLASATPDFGKQKVSQWISAPQRGSIIEWWISNAYYSKEALGLLNISSKVRWRSSSGDKGVLKVLEIVSKVGRQGEYIYGLGGFSWSGDIILATIQLGNNLLSII